MNLIYILTNKMLTKFTDTEIHLINFFDLNSLYNYAYRIVQNFNAFQKKISIKM